MNNTWVEHTLAGLTLEEKVGQLMMVCFFGLDAKTLPDVLKRMKRYGLGGYFQCKNSMSVLRDCNEVIQSEMKVPVLMAVDLESGPGYMLEGGRLFPRQMARAAGGDEKKEFEIGRVTALQGRAAGVNMTASPVLDVHLNPLYPDGNTRAYGDDPSLVTKLGTAYIRGLQSHGMAAIAKHFPGNGSTDMDQHIAAAYVPESRSRMEKIFLRPYADAIRRTGLLSVMVSHLDIPSLVREKHPVDGLPVPTSLSREIVTGILKKKLGFTGAAMTDAFNMGGINNRYTRAEAAVKAVRAGIDILLVFDPGNFEVEYDAVLKAVRDGAIALSRLDDAVRNVLTVKQKLGLDKDRGMPLPGDEFRRTVLDPVDDSLSRSIAEKAVTVLRNDRKLLPLPDMRGKKALVVSVFTPDRELAQRKGHKPFVNAIPGLLKSRGCAVDEIEITGSSTPEDYLGLTKKRDAADILFLDFFGIPSYAIGSMLPNQPAMDLFYKGILNCGRPVVLTCIGDPYVARHAPSAGALVCTFDETVFSQEAAVKAWFGEIATTGRSPVRILPVFERGAGLTI
jgi:beta-N-acetylhexosaminidase